MLITMHFALFCFFFYIYGFVVFAVAVLAVVINVVILVHYNLGSSMKGLPFLLGILPLRTSEHVYFNELDMTTFF